jgi:hypothetical protein
MPSEFYVRSREIAEMGWIRNSRDGCVRDIERVAFTCKEESCRSSWTGIRRGLWFCPFLFHLWTSSSRVASEETHRAQAWGLSPHQMEINYVVWKENPALGCKSNILFVTGLRYIEDRVSDNQWRYISVSLINRSPSAKGSPLRPPPDPRHRPRCPLVGSQSP